MSAKEWAKLVFAEPGAAERVGEIEEELRLAASGTDDAGQRIGPGEQPA